MLMEKTQKGERMKIPEKKETKGEERVWGGGRGDTSWKVVVGLVHLCWGS